jgi:hypothetical protein
MKTPLLVESPMNATTCFHSIHSTKIQRNIENLVEIHSTKIPMLNLDWLVAYSTGSTALRG